MSEAEAKKRPASPSEDTDSDSDDGWIGPTLSEAAPVKKKKALPFENVYLENLPHSDTYERSFMHRDVVSWCLSSGSTCFVITGSVDGHVKVSYEFSRFSIKTPIYSTSRLIHKKSYKTQ